jgi:transposase-like protein
MTKSTRRRFSAAFKAKVVLEALTERQTLEALAKTYELHPNQITNWKREFVARAASVFEGKGAQQATDTPDTDKLYATIGQLKIENDFLKKKLS